MKFLIIGKIFLILINSATGKLTEFSNYDTNLDLVKAVAQGTEEISLKNLQTVNLIMPECLNCLKLQDFKENLLNFHPDLVYRQETSEKIQIISRRRRAGNAFIIQTFEDFMKIYEKLSSKMFKFNGFYLVVLVAGEISEIENIFNLFLKLQIFNINIIYADKTGSVLVKTFFPFNPGGCLDPTPVLINEFKNGISLNQSQFFTHKLKNLHKCPIRVSVAKESPPYIIAKASSNKSFQLSGIDINFVETLADKFNFSFFLTFIGETGVVLDNGTSTGAFQALSEHKADLTVSGWLMRNLRSKFFDSSTSYVSDVVVLAIPSGEDFTSLEKLFYPYSKNVWLLVFVCFVVGFLMILVVNRQSKTVQNFVFGTGVKTPYLNLFIGFIGDSQNILPRRNFARFLLMVFLLYSLIMRSLYQGCFYDLLKSNKKHSEVQSMQEMVHKKFFFYVTYAGVTELLIGVEAIANR